MNENPQGSRPLREESNGHAQAAVSAQLHHHAGQQHRSGGRRGHMARGRPGVERPHARQNRKPRKHQRKAPHLEAHRKAGMRQLNQSRGVAARRRISRQQADEHHRRAHERIERQLHRRVLPPRRAPDGDQEVLGDDGDFVEDKKQEEVEAEKDAVNAADQRQEEREKLVGAQLDVPTEQHAGHCGEAGQQHQHAADAVGGQQEVNPHRRHPGQIDQHLRGPAPCRRQIPARPAPARPPPQPAQANAPAPGRSLGSSACISAPANER